MDTERNREVAARHHDDSNPITVLPPLDCAPIMGCDELHAGLRVRTHPCPSAKQQNLVEDKEGVGRGREEERWIWL